MPVVTAGHDRRKYNGRWFYELNSTIARACGKNGETEPDLARALLAYFCHCVEKKSVPDARVMHYLADAFKEFISHGENGDIAKTLGLKRRKSGNPGPLARTHKGSPRLTLDEREEMRQEIAQRLSKGESHAKIQKDLSLNYGTSESTVRTSIRAIDRTNRVQGGEQIPELNPGDTAPRMP